MAKKVRRRATMQVISDEAPTPKASKSQAIRDYLIAHPDAKPKAVVEALAADGTTVSPNMVSLIKSKSGAKTKAKKAKASGADESTDSSIALLTLYRAACGKPTDKAKIDAAFMLLVGST